LTKLDKTSWREKLAFLQQQEAVTTDANQKFALRKQIEEAKAKITELESKEPKLTLVPETRGIDDGITDGLLRFDKMLCAELIRAETTTFNDEDVAALLWGSPRVKGGTTKAWFKLMAEVAAEKNIACKEALAEIEDLFPVYWQREDKDRYPENWVLTR
jgi:hypothetical protein